jgi:HSP20 family molecular chaperone IbpA
MFKMESPFERLDPVITEGISEREDEEAIYYDIKVDDVKSTSIDTKVNNGYLTITGTTEKKTVSGDNENNDVTAGSVYRSTFNKTFPLPDHIDPNKMQMITEKDKIVLKFPKIKA